MELELDEVRALIQGKFDFRQCLDCDGRGIVLCDGDHGMVITGSSIPNDRDPMDFYWDQCDSCNGLGGYLKFT